MATHKELITAGKFSEKFKRVLLDYYSYGFKSLSSFDAKKHQTISEDWLRLNRVIADYMQWSEDRHDVMFASADSQSMESNPFHRIYRFCKYNPFTYPAYFLHTMAALSDSFDLRNGVDALDLDDDQRIHMEGVLKRAEGLKTSDLICFYTEKLAPSVGKDRNKTPNNRLSDLEQLGLVSCKQASGANGKGDRRWSLPFFTMRTILNAGTQVSTDFERHLHSALDFFSKYYLLGEVGTFLCDRIYSDTLSPFRFKHEYFMQALNDFNIVDLFHGMEHNKWCKIKYRHGIRNAEREILCYPLEIRISNMNGREYLMCYEPFKHSYTALRIEFIDAVEFFDDSKVKRVLVHTGACLAPEDVDAEIANARASLQHAWGVSTTQDPIGNAQTVVVPHPVHFKIAYTPKDDYFIVNRLYRERRIGSVPKPDGSPYLHFYANVSDEMELRPWMRSFYSRIVSCDGMESDSFALDSDVAAMVRVLIRDKLEPQSQNTAKHSLPKWEIPEAAKTMLGTGVKAREHDLLFNEVFCIYYYIIAEVFVRLSSSPAEKSYNRQDLLRIIEDSFHKFYLLIGQETESLLPDEILELLMDGGFLEEISRPIPNAYEMIKNHTGTGFIKRQKTEKAYVSKYVCQPGLQLYRDVVPLTILELRWLKTIVHDQKMSLFFSKDEVTLLQNLLDENAASITPLPMGRVVFFDRFHFTKKNRKREATVLSTILEGIYDQKTVQLKYHTNRKGPRRGEFRPIVLEFSKRNNRFQGFFQHCKTNAIFTFNIAQIETASETDTSFDYAAAEEALAEYRQHNTTSVEIEFSNVKNIVDRILTEFSPWEKRCSYDAKTGMYRLTIFYQTLDELELVVRLLGYGAAIRFVDKTHPMVKEIQLRMKKQMDLIAERRKEHNVQEPGESR